MHGWCVLWVYAVLAAWSWSCGQREEERSPFADLRLHPDPAAVSLNDLLADRQTDPGAGVLLPRMEPLEDAKDPLGVLGVEPNPVIPHRKHPFLPVSLRGDMDTGESGATKLQRIPDQILHHLP